MSDTAESYRKSLDFIYSFVDHSLSHLPGDHPRRFDLMRMEAFMAALGSPHRQYPCIHVAGTKGKGSTVAMIASVLQKSGCRVGFYCSPHLEDFNERIQVNRQPIPHQAFIDLLEEIKPVIDQFEKITTFEIITALGFLYFQRQQVDIAVIEVGLGGRLDSTNVLLPLVSVITSISFDHTEVLGETLEKIAGEKAGIIKPGCPVVISPQKEEARQVLERVSRERGCPLVQVGKDVLFTLLEHSLEKQTFTLQAAANHWPGQMQTLQIPLLGTHQVENAVTAYTALVVAAERLEKLPEWHIPFNLTRLAAVLGEGLANVQWEARFEILQRQPLVIIDSAHNRDSAARLRQTLTDYLPGKRIILLFGSSKGKDIEGMFAELLPGVQQVIMTRSIHPRSCPAEELASLAESMGFAARAITPVEDALEAALASAGEDDVILTAGSLFVAAAVHACWRQRAQK